MTGRSGGVFQDDQFRALIVGLGSIGQRHARNLRELLGEQVRLFAHRVVRNSPVVTDDLKADAARRPEDVYGIETFDSLDDALNHRPHAAWICNPTSQHLATALRCASAGCDLFLEKPVSDSGHGIDRLQSVVEAAGLVVGVSSQLRFHPALRRMKTAIGQGELGRPLVVRAEVGEYLPGFHPYEDYRTSYAARRSMGGGVVLTLIHDLDYLLWLFGAPRRLFALGGKLSSLELDVEDVASILMECEGEHGGFPVHLQMDFIHRPPRRTCHVLCDAGSLDLDLRANRLQLTNAEGDVLEVVDVEPFERNHLFLMQMSDFLDARQVRRSPAVTLEDGITAVQTADAVRESMTSKRIVGMR
jgi:predicted dehydrogenase